MKLSAAANLEIKVKAEVKEEPDVKIKAELVVKNEPEVMNEFGEQRYPVATTSVKRSRSEEGEDGRLVSLQTVVICSLDVIGFGKKMKTESASY